MDYYKGLWETVTHPIAAVKEEVKRLTTNPDVWDAVAALTWSTPGLAAGIERGYNIVSSAIEGDAYGAGHVVGDLAGEVALNAALYAASEGANALLNGSCFVAGTQIATATGNVAIEDIQAGDMVWAEDPETGEKTLKHVVQTFVRESDELVHIEVGRESITTTPDHPFWVPQKGWTSAIELRSGDRLSLLNGEIVIVESVQHELLESPVTVYNFEVEDFHTYFVSDIGVFVHNTCVPNSPNKVGTDYLKNNGIDPHAFKADILGKGADISKWNIFRDGAGNLWLGDGKSWIDTYMKLKP